MRNYSRHLSFLIIAILLVSLTSCDKDFKSINTSVDFVSKPNLDYELPFAELTLLDKNYYTHAYYAGPYCGHINTNSSYPSMTAYRESEMSEHFNWVYKNPLRTVSDMIDQSKDDPAKINYLSMARILRAYLFQSLTDVYGDIPYFDACKGYTNLLMTPNYDPQQKIYEDMFKELQGAATALTTAKALPENADIVYKGDISKWKKFAYSLMLRLGLRIMKADAVNGKKWIETAIAGGVMTSKDDNFVVSYTNQLAGTGTTSNGVPHIFISSSYITTYRLAAAFVDSLKSRNDPRTPVFCMREKLPLTFYQEGDHTPANQRGRRQFDNLTPRDSCSVSNIKTLGRYDAPYIHLSHAQVQFQLAECVARGITTGDAKAYYEAGVRSAMSELSIFGAGGIISTTQQDDYLAANPYVETDAIKMIAVQYWLETHYNWYEAWANMRRTGFPDLYSGLDLTLSANLGAQLPRRLYYPRAEYATNPHINEAVQRQGEDNTGTRVWWDKP
ncbi:MAG: SusD/RagB family nutrient-binding outer membrane lipoprotein [Chitinophagaceae bacterium]|nr:SusD/RagB family nutrient-binding outer membrane lipoprotein [Chitinophagaceae bacterium]